MIPRIIDANKVNSDELRPEYHRDDFGQGIREKPESWLGMFKSEGKIVGDIISPAINKNQWEVLTK